MATLKEYFQTDFANALTFFFSWKTTGPNPIDIDVKVGTETYSSAKFVAYWVPHHAHFLQIFESLVNSVDEAVTQSNGIRTLSSFGGDVQYGLIGSDNSPFSNRVYIYSDDVVDDAPDPALDALCKQKMLWLTVRGQQYMKTKIELEKPMAFISHDSRDKTDIALPITIGLQKLMCHVWYDEYSLKVGDSLRESIEKGLKETKKCVLILSPNFISNGGWTKVEFNSVFTREILEQRSVVLPVWHNVSARQVYEYSPSLADKVGLNWEQLGEAEVVRKLYNAITEP
ncbi:TIR domain-containing protein [Bradyrhizobium lablabi]|uniref:TIR domain-containing protein n=1 Tax=Bradyrhizobium lablabi TaxID=722472 RepID=A0A1M6QQB2_9BRAD|nr:toll/interleukin-1 receptor domain-containing protein [Bradyrhizobium lablabi]SHK22283.1 TIR domain-containing protein [Bradyrhizobium lablabi]